MLSAEQAGLILIVMCSVAVLLNSVMITLFVLEKKQRKTYKMAFLNLAISDLVLAMYGAIFKGRGKMG